MVPTKGGIRNFAEGPSVLVGPLPTVPPGAAGRHLTVSAPQGREGGSDALPRPK